jgi:hypothetical protein
MEIADPLAGHCGFKESEAQARYFWPPTRNSWFGAAHGGLQ